MRKQNLFDPFWVKSTVFAQWNECLCDKTRVRGSKTRAQRSNKRRTQRSRGAFRWQIRRSKTRAQRSKSGIRQYIQWSCFDDKFNDKLNDLEAKEAASVNHTEDLYVASEKHRENFCVLLEIITNCY
jgi:hypothetical protein